MRTHISLRLSLPTFRKTIPSSPILSRRAQSCPVGPTPTLSRRGPTRAGPHSGTPAAATNARRGGSECGWRDAREFGTELAKARGRVGLSEELAGFWSPGVGVAQKRLFCDEPVA